MGKAEMVKRSGICSCVLLITIGIMVLVNHLKISENICDFVTILCMIVFAILVVLQIIQLMQYYNLKNGQKKADDCADKK